MDDEPTPLWLRALGTCGFIALSFLLGFGMGLTWPIWSAG